MPEGTQKNTLVGVELEVHLVEVGERFLEVRDEGFLLTGLDNDVVDVRLYVFAHLVSESDVHQPLESGAGIPQAHGHAHIAEHTTRGDERYLLLVLLSHLDLVVPREGIQEAKEVAACRGVHDLIDPWQWVRVLGASFIEVGEFHAEAQPSS